MKAIRKALTIFPIVAALLVGGILLPDAVFSLYDKRELTEITLQPVDAVDLQLSSENTLYRRMQMLSQPPTMMQTAENLTSKEETDIVYKVDRFLQTTQIQALGDGVYKTVRIAPVLYTSTNLQLSAVFWEVEMVLGEQDNYRLYLVVDDISGNVVGLRLDTLIDPSPSAPMDPSQYYSILNTLRYNYEWTKTALVDNRDAYIIIKNRWYGSTCYYAQSTLHIRDEGKQYSYLCYYEKNTFIFNLYEGEEIKKAWNLKFEDSLEAEES